MKLALLMLFLSGSVLFGALPAQTITGKLEGISYTYTSYESGFKMTNVDTTPDIAVLENNLELYLYCIDFRKDSYYVENGRNHISDYMINEELTTIGQSKTWSGRINQDKDLAIGQLGFLVDNYSQLFGIDGTALQKSAFAWAIWEVTSDGGKSSSLSLSSGEFIRNSTSGSTNLLNLSNTIISDVQSNTTNGNITSSYTWQSGQYIIKDNNKKMQDYIIIRPIPEPTTSILLLAPLAMLVSRRKR